MIRLLVALALTSLFAPIAIAAAEEAPASVTMQERCDAFCGKVYGTGSTEEVECVAGCREADACSRQCDVPFPDDNAKHATCLKRCMRKAAVR